MKSVLAILNMFAGPIGGLVEKGLFGLVVYAIGKGWIQGDAAGIAATLYAAFSTLFTSVVGTQTAKAQSIVDTQGNGITVVPKQAAVAAGIASVTAPQ